MKTSQHFSLCSNGCFNKYVVLLKPRTVVATEYFNGFLCKFVIIN